MSTKPHYVRAKGSVLILRVCALICLIPAVIIFIWYAWTRLSGSDTSAILPGQLRISDVQSSCMLNIPDGTLIIQHPLQPALGSESSLLADIKFDEPLSFSDCSGAIPNWNLQVESQVELIGAEIAPGSVIRQPLSGVSELHFNWDFDFPYILETGTSHLWLRILVLDGSQTVERWSLLVREFPMRSVAFFGLAAAPVLLIAAVLGVIGILLLILARIKRSRNKPAS